MDVLEKTKENLAPGQRTEGELSRKEQLALYQQRKVLMQQKGANKPNHNAGLTKPKNAQGLRDKLQVRKIVIFKRYQHDILKFLI